MKKLKEICNLFVVRTLEMIISIYLGLMVMFYEYQSDVGLILKEGIEYLPLVLSICLLALFILEFLNSKPYIRMVYLIIAFFLVFLVKDNIYKMNLFIWFLGFVYLILMLITYLRTKPNKYLKVKNDSSKLPVANFSKKQVRVNQISFFGSLVMGVIFMIIWIKVFSFNWFSGFVICVFLVCIITFGVAFKFNPIFKALNLMNYEIKFNEFMKIVNELKNNNLHEDTYSYLLMLEANYLVLVDKKKSIEVFETIKKPEFKDYLKLYLSLEICYYLNKEENELVKEKIDLLKKKYPRLKKQLEAFETQIAIKDINVYYDNIEEIFKVNTPIKFTNLVNANILMGYYLNRNNLKKAKEFASIIIKDGIELKETYNNALLVLNSEN